MPPSPTYTAISTLTLSGNASSITFSSIPNSYRDLILIVYGRTDANRRYEFITLNLNNSTTDVYSTMKFYWENGNRGALHDATDTSGFAMIGPMGSQASANHFNTCRFEIFDYSSTDKHKQVLFTTDDPGRQSYVGSGRYPSASAVTSLTFKTIQGASMIAGTVASLYGVSG